MNENEEIDTDFNPPRRICEVCLMPNGVRCTIGYCHRHDAKNEDDMTVSKISGLQQEIDELLASAEIMRGNNAALRVEIDELRTQLATNETKPARKRQRARRKLQKA